MRTPTTTLLALGTAAALGLAACGGGNDATTPAVSGIAIPAQEQPATTEAEQPGAEATQVGATVDDAASTLRADLTRLLQEQVHLTGLAVDAIIDGGRDGAEAQAAIAALEEATTALGERIGGLPGVDDPEAFLEPWRQQNAAFIDYAVATVDEDDAAAADATAALEDGLQPVADLFEEVTDEEVAAEELVGELQTHVTMVTDAIDAMVAGDEEASDLLREAALHLDSVAADLAAGVVAAHPDEVAGDPRSVPAETRATLTSALVEHTYLTLLAAGEAGDAGGDPGDAATQAAVTTLDTSADDLANAISGAAGTEGREAFLDVWRPFLTAATDYAMAQAAGDAEAATAARGVLDAAPDALVELFEEATGGNAPDDLLGALRSHVANVTTAIDAIVAGDPAVYAQARTAVDDATTIATGLAAAIVAADTGEVVGDGGATDIGATGNEDAEGLNADPSTAAPDEAADGTSGAGTVGTVDAGAATDDVGPGANAGSEGDVDGEE